MLFQKSLKIWLLTNISGAFILATYLATTGKSEGEFVPEFFSLILFMFAFGSLFSIPAIPILLLTLGIEAETHSVPAKIVVLFLGNALAVLGVLMLDSHLLDIKLTSDYGENLLEFTWPHLFTSFISTFLVTGKSIFSSNNPATLKSEEYHES